MRHQARLFARLVRAEGLRAVVERLRTRSHERREAAADRVGMGGDLAAAHVSVLNVLPVSSAPSLGGVQVQLRARLLREAGERATALLSPEGRTYVLRCRAGARRTTSACGADLVSALAAAAQALHPRALHVENLATTSVSGLSLALPTLRALRAWPSKLIVSVHDFACFCPRPLLVERPALSFCGFSRDLARCGRCLSSEDVADADPAALRAEAALLFERAAAIVCPSEFVRARLMELWPGVGGARIHAIVPSRGLPHVTRHGAWPPRHVAFVGAVRLEKGAGALLQIAARVLDLGLRVSAYGGGDPSLLVALRRAGVHVHGFYAPDRLTSLLVRDGVDLALVPSIGPESHALVVDESWAAGVPVVAFDVGAVGERVRTFGGGRLVPLERGAEGLLEALRALMGAGRDPRLAPPTSPGDPSLAAREHLALYQRLGLL